MGVEDLIPAKNAFMALDGIGDKRIQEITRIHAGVAAGMAFIPIPLVAVPAMMANVYAMYGRINAALGIKFSENILKSIGGMLAANVGSTLATVAACEAIKFIPIIGSIGGAVGEAVIFFGSTKVQGALYCEWLKAMCKKGAIGADGTVNTAEAKEVMSEVCEDADIKKMMDEAKKEARSTNLKQYKAEARRLMEEEQARQK